MKIIDVIPHAISVPLENPFYFSQGWAKNRSAVIVEIITDEGFIGSGRRCTTFLDHLDKGVQQ